MRQRMPCERSKGRALRHACPARSSLKSTLVTGNISHAALECVQSAFPDRIMAAAQAMSLMLPKNVSRRQLPDEATLESRMDCMRLTSSYSCAALNNVNLDAILDDIKCNLRKEQHIVLELNWHVLYHVLAPIQVNIPSPRTG